MVGDFLTNWSGKIISEGVTTMHEANVPKLLTVKQAAELLQVSIWTIRRWIHADALPCIRIGREFRIKRDSLTEFSVMRENFEKS